MTPANDMEAAARDATACTEFPADRRHRFSRHISPGLSLRLIVLGVGAGLTGIIVAAVVIEWLAR